MFLGKLKEKLAPREERESKILDLNKARSFFFDNTQEMLSNRFESASKLQQQIVTKLDQLSGEIRELGKAEKEEARKGSEAIKNRYVEHSLDALHIDRRGKNFEQIESFLEETRQALKELDSISQKESMHLKFFYREEMKKIAQKAKEISQLADQLDQELSSGFMEKREYVKEIIDEIEDLKERKIELAKKIEEIPENTKSLRKAIKNVERERQGIDFNEYESDKAFVENLENQIEAAESAIRSSFASVERLLRKQDYREPDQLLKQYLQNPVKAFLNDSNNHILRILKKAQKIDDQQSENAQELVNTFQNLRDYRKQLISATSKLKKKKKYIEKVYKPKEKRAEEIEKQIEGYEKRIEEMDTKRAHKIMEKRTLEEKIQKKKQELAEKIGDILDMEILIR